MALWDILGKCANLPLYRLLGGAVPEWVPTKWSVSGVEPSRAAEIAAWAVEQGFRSMKVKVGLDPEQDLARVRAVRAAVGPDVPLGVDANGGWSVHEAVEMVRRIREFDIHFVEQPVAPLDVAWMVEVRRRIELPVLADESVYSLQDAMALARAGAADLFSIYVGKAGGIGPALRQAWANSTQSCFQSPGMRANRLAKVGTPSPSRKMTPRLYTTQISAPIWPPAVTLLPGS